VDIHRPSWLRVRFHHGFLFILNIYDVDQFRDTYYQNSTGRSIDEGLHYALRVASRVVSREPQHSDFSSLATQ